MILMGLIVLLSACQHTRPVQHQQTPECMRYQHMMTAPIPPDVMKQLEQACKLSNK